MKRISRLIPAIITLAAVIASGLPSNAAGYLYAGKRKTVNCGIVVLGSGATTGNYTQPLGLGSAGGAGDLFNLLDYLTSMKPAGWSLDNPYAPVDTNGKKPDKQNPLFWQVNLATARNLSRMNVLYLPAANNVKLADEDREKLRRFVDGGGVLWVDNSGVTGNPLTFTDGLGLPSSTPGTFFLPNVYFMQSTATTGRDIAASRHHPLLTSPYWIEDQEIPMLGASWGASAVNPGYSLGSTGDWKGLQAPLFTDVLFPIVSKLGGGETSIAANTYGSGRIVATANFVGGGCFLPYPHNMPSLKFAYNVMAWASSWTDLRKDPRHSGRSIDTVGGTELLKMWSLKPAPPNGESGAVIYKNVAFYSSGGALFALDVKPQEDLDQDGNPDDGLQGVGGMTNDGQDVIWIWQGDGGMLSTPEVVTAQNPNNPYGTVEAVLVMSSSGNVYMLNAFPNQNGILMDQPSPIVPPWTTYATPHPNPPIYINGWVYTAAGDGRLYAYNPSLEIWNASNDPDVASHWVMPSDFANAGGNATLKSGPNFGFVSTGNSGAVVGMVYWCATAPPVVGGVGGMEQNDHIYGVPVYVKNDRLKLRATTPATGEYTEFQTAYMDANISSTPPPVVRIETRGITPTNIVVTPNRGIVNGILDKDNIKRGAITVQVTGGMPTDAMVYADYSLDYASAGGLTVVQYPRIRVPLQPSSNSNNDISGYMKTEIVATPALGPDSMIYVNGVRGNANVTMGGGGSVYGLKNDGTMQQTKWNYMLHSGVPPVALQGITTGVVPLPGLLVEKPLSAQSLNYMFRPQSFSSPVVSGDKVFVTVSGDSSGPMVSRGALLCFKASPDFVIRINENGGFGPDGRPIKTPKRLYDMATNRPLQVKVWQPDLLGNVSGLGPTAEAVTVPNNMIDRERGTITFDTFDRPKLRGGVGGGLLGLVDGNTFSPSLPVWVSLDNVEVPIDWSTWGPSVSLAKLMMPPVTIPSLSTDSVDLSGWSNLLWYYVVPPFDKVPCSGIHSSPVVVGDTVYFETDDGILYALNAETGESLGGPIDPFDSTNTNWKPDPQYVLWREKVSDVGGGLPSSANVSPSGSNGVMLVPGPDGLYAYSNPTTLVADNNRLVEVDAAGEVNWSVDSFFVPVSIPPSDNQPPARRSVPVNKPARARYISTGEILITNSGTNQVCKIDKSGSVGVQKVRAKAGTTLTDGWIRWVYDKFTDPKHLLRPGQPTEIRSPTDAIFWTEMEPLSKGDQTVVTHCLIADSGNSRVLDLVYRFNEDKLIVTPGTEPDSQSLFILPELNWVSNTESKAERYVFDCLQVVPNPNTSQGGHDIWAAISNFRVDPNSPNPQGLGGAIVDLNYRRLRGGGGWDYGQVDIVTGKGPGEIIAACDHVTPGGNPAQPLANPRYFQAIMRQNGMHLIICDNHGVYDAGPTNDPNMPIVRMISDNDYREMIDRDDAQPNVQSLGVPLSATNVQEMPNGHWLITNSYSGSDKSGTKMFNGEVFEYQFDPNNLTGIGKIVWSAPKLEFSYPISASTTVYDWKQEMERSYILQQPRSAFRQF
ncbi:MAG: PQQ-binding-like beta-propeller repeat protein [Armatimonadetes bacterium]|nr:PQQ-binding-like beta-propeller repeat protein [Armatimonadota bacterium]